MEIRKIAPEEMIEALKIRSVCFTINRDFSAQEKFDEGWEDVRALFNSEGKMCAYLRMIPFEFRMNGHTVKMAGIGDVASLPEHRNKGYVKKIMKACLEEMREEGQIFSFLYPFSNPYYRQFGYESGSRVQQVSIPLTAFKELKTPGHAKHFVYAEDIGTVKALYSAFIEDKNLSIVREDKQFKSLFDRDAYKELYHTYIWHNAEGKAVSYLSFEVIEGSENNLDVTELVWSGYEGLKGILGFLYTLHPYFTNFTGLLPGFIDFKLLLSEPGNVKAEQKARGMNRIVDVEKALALLTLPDEAGQIAIEVKDDFCEWNTGTYAVQWENGRVSVERKDAKADLCCSIQTLTQLVTGAVSLRELRDFTGLTVNRQQELLDAIFTKKTMFLRDFF